MSTVPFAPSFSPSDAISARANDPLPAAMTGRAVRRRGDYQQGRALEMLGHAIEYLTDTRMFASGSSAARVQALTDAIQILTRASRAVFLECPEVVPIHRQIGRKLSRLVGGW